MSFLNPVNEPVLRFSSTDAGAPQINYDARVAGDVKAVLKACLVTGYGAKASAGWSIVNEVNHVAEFVSPIAAMGDYRLGVDDTSAASTTWYYQYQDVRSEPTDNKILKNMRKIDLISDQNGWQLLVTARGLFLIEIVKSVHTDGKVARLTYWGQVKSALQQTTLKNITFFSVGSDAPNVVPTQFFQNIPRNNAYVMLGDFTGNWLFTGANINTIEKSVARGNSLITVTSDLYLSQKSFIAAKYPGILINDVALDNEIVGVYDTVFESRPVIHVCNPYTEVSIATLYQYSVSVYLALDFWEY